MIFYFAHVFGTDLVKKKKYLHNAQHVHILEKIAMQENMATAEEYMMQGREHRNKTLGREFKQKFEGTIETRKPV